MNIMGNVLDILGRFIIPVIIFYLLWTIFNIIRDYRRYGNKIFAAFKKYEETGKAKDIIINILDQECLTKPIIISQTVQKKEILKSMPQEQLAKMLEENGETVDSDILKQPNIDIPTEVDKDCDILIESFIQNGLLVLLVIDGYQYLLDTFLADEVLKQTTTDPTVISKMIKTTEELGNMNLQSVLDLFNMQDVLSKDSGNTLSRKRVK